MKALTAAVGALLATALAAGCGGSVQELLPDLDQAAPDAVSVERRGSRLLLIFGSAVDNVGSGSIILLGSRERLDEPAMTVSQVVRQSDGSRRTYAVRGSIVYVESETHEHWHLLDFDRYELREALSGELVRPARKTGFCLGDRYETSLLELTGEPQQAVLTGECGPDAPELLRVVEGISVGYGDDYVPELEGQAIDVTGLPAGRYVLVHRANPEGALREANYENNAASLLIELRPAQAAVRVLGRCPDSERCGNPGASSGVEGENEGGEG